MDTNVILDFLAERHPFYEPTAKIVSLADWKEISLFNSPISFTTVEYVLSKFESKESALFKFQKFSILCLVAEANQERIEKSFFALFSDFEDAVQYFCALQSNSDLILTRNKADFKNSVLPVFTVSEFLASLLK